MKKLILLYVLAASMLFAACSDSTDEEYMPGDFHFNRDGILGDSAGYYREGSLVYFFYEPDTLDSFFMSPSKGFNVLCFSLYALRDVSKRTEKIWRKGSQQYQNHIEYYGDTLYPKSYHSYSGEEYEVSAMPLNSVNITADKDFDTEHPAGASLNDLFVFKFTSADNVIKSNYNTDMDITFYYRDHYEDAFETMPLSDFEPLNLLHYQSFLYFSKLPEQLGTYEFTITFDFGKDPVSGREVNVPPAVIKAEFTEKDHVTLP